MPEPVVAGPVSPRPPCDPLDTITFEAYVAARGSWLVGLAARLLAHPSHAEDVVQDVPDGQAGAGEVDVVTDSKGTTDYGYGTDANGAVERRGTPTSVTVSGAGTYAAAYDADGAMVTQTMPGGLRQDMTLDAAGEPIGLSYSGRVVNPDDGSTSMGVWLSWAQVNDVTGRVRQEWTPAGAAFDDPSEGAQAYDRTYLYDRAARLTTVKDRTAGPGATPTDPDDSATLVAACTTRTYGFDKNGHRTAFTAYPAASGGACSAGTTPTSTRSWTVDNADRLTNAGYTYDLFGRTLSIPAADNPTSGGPGLTLGYYDTDAAHMITTGTGSTAVTTTYTLDPAGRRLVATTAPTSGGAATSVLQRHYGDGGDNPAWVYDTVTATTTRYAESLAGDLSVEITTTGGVTTASLALANLHGDTVTTITLPTSGDATGIDAWSDYTEYGTARNPAATAAVAGPVGYGWLGAKQRATDTSGLTLMGARLHNSDSARFTGIDPIIGGGENAYSYPNDPINLYDLDGHSCRDASNWSAGFGDIVTFGGTKQIRGLINYKLNGDPGDIVDHKSIYYRWGRRGGTIASFFDVPAGGASALSRMGRIRGGEILLGGGRRLALLGGSRPRRWYEWLPHHHRRFPGPGGGIGRHRPWQQAPQGGLSVEEVLMDRIGLPIIAIDGDDVYIFASLQEVQDGIEPYDIESGDVRFYDSSGKALIASTSMERIYTMVYDRTGEESSIAQTEEHLRAYVLALKNVSEETRDIARKARGVPEIVRVIQENTATSRRLR